jgi:hypothetical protein
MAKITVQQISRRAKQTRKKGEAWIAAIKRASKELKNKSGTVSTRKPGKKSQARRKTVPRKKTYSPRKPIHQTGSSSKKIDKRIKAKAPGKRRVKTAKGSHAYYEYRRNRSDMPGSMTGTNKNASGQAYREMILRRMRDADRVRGATEYNITMIKKQKEALPRTAKLQRKLLDLRIVELKKFLAVTKKELSMLKTLYR